MNPSAPAGSVRIKYPPGFRPRRGLNWVILGLMYAAYYTCRYNFRWAAPGMEKEFGFNDTQITSILSAWSIAYGTGQLSTASSATASAGAPRCSSAPSARSS